MDLRYPNGKWRSTGRHRVRCAGNTKSRQDSSRVHTNFQLRQQRSFLADFLAGCFTSPTNIVEGDPKRQVFENTFSLFGQDAWQVTHQLNFNYGLRYGYSGPIHSQYHDLI